MGAEQQQFGLVMRVCAKAVHYQCKKTKQKTEGLDFISSQNSNQVSLKRI